MITQILRLGALIATGRFLRPRLKGLLLLTLMWVLLWFVHSEYVSYVELSGDSSWVLRASLLKLVLYALSVGLYVLLVERPLWPKPLKMPLPTNPATPSLPAPDPASAAAQALEGDDGFDFLRHKPRLKGPADTQLHK